MTLTRYINLGNIRQVLTSKYWLILTLFGAFFSFFALNRGGIDLFLELSIIFLLVNLLTGNYPIRKIPTSLVVSGFICAYLLLTSILVAPHQSNIRWMFYLLRMIGAVFAIHCLSQKSDIKRNMITSSAVVLSLAVCWQFVARNFLGSPNGTFTNLHYLATFSALSLPIAFYFFQTFDRWYKWLLMPVGLMDIELLLRTGSRPAILGLAFSIILVSALFIKGNRKWFCILSFLVVLTILLLTNYANVSGRFQELIVNLPKEERVQFWNQTWDKLNQNSVQEWLFGHGISYIPTIYKSGSRMTPFVFPHIVFLELLYLNGIIGFSMVSGGFLILGTKLIQKGKRLRDRGNGLFFTCMLVVFLTWLVHCGATVPIYSKYSQYPLAFILGTLIAVLTNGQNKVGTVARIEKT